MEKKNTSVFYNALIWGLIIGFAGIIYSVILYMLDLHLNQNLGYAGMLISLVILIFAVRSFRDNIRGGILPFGTAFSFGFLALIIGSILGTIYGLILWTVIDPDIISRMQELQVEKMLEKGLPEEGLDRVLPRLQKFMQPGILATFGLLSSAFFSAIIALIVAAIFKRDDETATPA
jgi:hypothetical protein